MAVFLNSQDFRWSRFSRFFRISMPFCTLSRQPDNKKIIMCQLFLSPAFPTIVNIKDWRNINLAFDLISKFHPNSCLLIYQVVFLKIRGSVILNCHLRDITSRITYSCYLRTQGKFSILNVKARTDIYFRKIMTFCERLNFISEGEKDK